MITRLMKTDISSEEIQQAQRHMKHFLNCFETFYNGIRDTKDKPTRISSSNFICLINLPRVLEEYGPLRNLWEGGGQGEK
jgi:hypothetical protein